MTIKVGVGARTIPIVAKTVGGLLIAAAATKPLTGARWPCIRGYSLHEGYDIGWEDRTLPPGHPALGFKFLGEARDTWKAGSSPLGLIFGTAYYAYVAKSIDAVEQSFMPGGTWPGWENIKILPALMQDEYGFITSLDQSAYRQILSQGASSGKAYLEKVKTMLAFWQKLEDHLIKHRLTHDYQGRTPGSGTIAKLKGQLGGIEAQLIKAGASVPQGR